MSVHSTPSFRGDDSHVCVAVRIRPPTSKEIASNATMCLTRTGDAVTILEPVTIEMALAQGVGKLSGISSPVSTYGSVSTPKSSQNLITADAILLEWPTAPKRVFKFDHVYDNATQQDIFNDVGRRAVDHAFAGYNTSIFAYGQTGSGKSHTMLGSSGIWQPSESFSTRSPKKLGDVPNTPITSRTSSFSDVNELPAEEREGLIPRICRAIFRRLEIESTRAVRAIERMNARADAEEDGDADLLGSEDRLDDEFGGDVASTRNAHPTDPSDSVDSFVEKTFPRFGVSVSYYEIYCERVRDLLNTDILLNPNQSSDSKKSGNTNSSNPPVAPNNLKVRESPSSGAFVEGLRDIPVSGIADIEKILIAGSYHRTVAETKMNESSSRSHAVFTLSLTRSECDVSTGLPVSASSSKIVLVDLAGSERYETLQEGRSNSFSGPNASSAQLALRQRELSKINTSLSALGSVIKALSSPSGGSGSNFVPYRNSVLTWLMKDSLGGNAKTTMLSTLSPAAASHKESMSTLKYSESVKRIVNHAVVNNNLSNEGTNRLIAELRSEIAFLRQQLAQKDSQMGLAAGAGSVAKSQRILTLALASTPMGAKAQTVKSLWQSLRRGTTIDEEGPNPEDDEQEHDREVDRIFNKTRDSMRLEQLPEPVLSTASDLYSSLKHEILSPKQDRKSRSAAPLPVEKGNNSDSAGVLQEKHDRLSAAAKGTAVLSLSMVDSDLESDSDLDSDDARAHILVRSDSRRSTNSISNADLNVQTSVRTGIAGSFRKRRDSDRSLSPIPVALASPPRHRSASGSSALEEALQGRKGIDNEVILQELRFREQLLMRALSGTPATMTEAAVASAVSFAEPVSVEKGTDVGNAKVKSNEKGPAVVAVELGNGSDLDESTISLTTEAMQLVGVSPPSNPVLKDTISSSMKTAAVTETATPVDQAVTPSTQAASTDVGEKVKAKRPLPSAVSLLIPSQLGPHSPKLMQGALSSTFGGSRASPDLNNEGLDNTDSNRFGTSARTLPLREAGASVTPTVVPKGISSLRFQGSLSLRSGVPLASSSLSSSESLLSPVPLRGGSALQGRLVSVADFAGASLAIQDEAAARARAVEAENEALRERLIEIDRATGSSLNGSFELPLLDRSQSSLKAPLAVPDATTIVPSSKAPSKVPSTPVRTFSSPLQVHTPIRASDSSGTESELQRLRQEREDALQRLVASEMRAEEYKRRIQGDIDEAESAISSAEEVVANYQQQARDALRARDQALQQAAEERMRRVQLQQQVTLLQSSSLNRSMQEQPSSRSLLEQELLSQSQSLPPTSTGTSSSEDVVLGVPILSEALSASRQELAAAQDEIVRLQEQLAAARVPPSASQTSSDLVSELESTRTQLEFITLSMQDRVLEATTPLLTSLAEERAEKSRLQARVESLSADIAAANLQVEASNAVATQAEERCAASIGRMHALESSLQAASDAVDMMREELAQLQAADARRAERLEGLELLESANEELTGRLDALERALTAAHVRSRELEQETLQLRAERDRALDSASEAAEARHSLEQEMLEQRRTYDELHEENRALEADLRKTAEALEAKIAELHNVRQTERAHAEQTLRGAANAASEALEELRRASEHQFAEASAEFSRELAAARAEAAAAHAALQQDKTRLTAERADFSSKLSLLEDSLAASERRVKQELLQERTLRNEAELSLQGLQAQRAQETRMFEEQLRERDRERAQLSAALFERGQEAVDLRAQAADAEARARAAEAARALLADELRSTKAQLQAELGRSGMQRSAMLDAVAVANERAERMRKKLLDLATHARDTAVGISSNTHSPLLTTPEHLINAAALEHNFSSARATDRDISTSLFLSAGESQDLNPAQLTEFNANTFSHSGTFGNTLLDVPSNRSNPTSVDTPPSFRASPPRQVKEYRENEEITSRKPTLVFPSNLASDENGARADAVDSSQSDSDDDVIAEYMGSPLPSNRQRSIVSTSSDSDIGKITSLVPTAGEVYTIQVTPPKQKTEESNTLETTVLPQSPVAEPSSIALRTSLPPRSSPMKSFMPPSSSPEPSVVIPSLSSPGAPLSIISTNEVSVLKNIDVTPVKAATKLLERSPEEIARELHLPPPPPPPSNRKSKSRVV